MSILIYIYIYTIDLVSNNVQFITELCPLSATIFYHINILKIFSFSTYIKFVLHNLIINYTVDKVHNVGQ